MAEYLIQGETLTDIADQIRSRTGSKDLIPPADMGRQVQLVYAKGYINGKDAITEGEARTASDVYTAVEAEAKNVEVSVTQGYYAIEVVKNVDVQDVYDAGYTEGYEKGLAAGGGGGGGDEPYDPTTVWLINDVPTVGTGIGVTINVPFVSAGEEFVKIQISTLVLNYHRSDGTIASAWGSRKGWTSDDYKTITFPDVITDETLQTWLDANATLISGGGGGGGQDADISPEDSLTFMEQVQSPSVVYMSLYEYCFILDNFGAYGGRTIEDMIEIEYSDLNSNPLTISLINYTDMYAHYYIKATDMANEEQGHLVHIEALPQGDNSIDIVSQQTTVPACDWKIEVQGARFTKYA